MSAQRLLAALSRITVRGMAEQTRKKRPKGQQTSITVSARLYPGEHSALERLLKGRAADMEAANMPPDPSFVGWLRAKIREDAAAKSIPIAPMFDASPAPTPKRRKTARG